MKISTLSTGVDPVVGRGRGRWASQMVVLPIANESDKNLLAQKDNEGNQMPPKIQLWIHPFLKACKYFLNILIFKLKGKAITSFTIYRYQGCRPKTVARRAVL